MERVTVEEWARINRIPRKVASRWARDGELPAIVVLGQICVAPDAPAPEDLTGWVSVPTFARLQRTTPLTVYRKIRAGVLTHREVKDVMLVRATDSMPRRRHPRLQWCQDTPPQEPVLYLWGGQLLVGKAPDGASWVDGSQGAKSAELPF